MARHCFCGPGQAAARAVALGIALWAASPAALQPLAAADPSSSGVSLRLLNHTPPGASDRTGSSAREPLKWRIPRATSEDPPGRIAPAGGIEQDRQHGDKPAPVRNAVQLAPADPLDDPFNDARRQRGDAPAPQQNGLAPQTETGDGTDQTDLPPPLPAELLDQPETPAAPGPDPDQPPPLPFRPAPPVDDLWPDRQPPTERVYRDRDCDEEDQRCRGLRQKLRDHPITQISLDISPSFQPDLDPQEEQQRKRRQLDMAPLKHWRDRDGQLIAVGHLTNFRDRRVVVTREDRTVVQIPFDDLSDDDMCFFAAWWGLPSECTLGDPRFEPRDWLASTFTWKASALCHKPLYFQEVQLERYGHTAGPFIQPVVSGAHFFLNIAALPYKMGINPPHECRYPLGYYRPGNCAPWMVPPVPLSVRGGLLQAGVVTGGAFVFP